MNQKIITTKNLDAGYGGRHSVLKNMNFSVGSGEMVGIIGPNGAGKSTLLKTLRGLLPIRNGRVLFNGLDIKDIKAHEFALQVAYLQQQVAISFGYTAREIVMAGRYPHMKWWQKESDEDKHLVRACMEYTGVWELADRPVHALSGGQRQRVLLAKVLAQQTPLLFLDEPATGLDVFYQEEIFRFCRELCRAGKTVILVVHELGLAARFCSRLLLLGQQHLIADGIPAAVLTQENLSDAYNAAVKVVQNPLTGNFDIFTQSPPTEERQKALQQILRSPEKQQLLEDQEKTEMRLALFEEEKGKYI